MSFEIVYDSVKEFEGIMATLGNFFEEATLHIAEDGITMKAIDPSRVVLVDMKLPDSLFAKYQVNGEETITISLERFLKALRLGRSGDTLLLKREGGHLTVGLLGAEKTYIKLPLIEGEVEGADIPKLDWTAKAIILARTFKRAVKAASLVGDSMFIAITGGTVYFKAAGETSEALVELGLEDEGLLDIEAEKRTESAFGVTYLSDAIKRLGDSDEVTIRLGNDMPALIRYAIRNEGEVKFLIAPRVEE